MPSISLNTQRENEMKIEQNCVSSSKYAKSVSRIRIKKAANLKKRMQKQKAKRKTPSQSRNESALCSRRHISYLEN